MSNKSFILKGLSIVAAIALVLGLGSRGALAQQDSTASVSAITAAGAAHVAKSDAAKRKQVVSWLCPPFCF